MSDLTLRNLGLTVRDGNKDLTGLTPKDKEKDLTPKTRTRTSARQIIINNKLNTNCTIINLSNVQW